MMLKPDIRKRWFASPVSVYGPRLINYRAIKTPLKGVKDLTAL